MSSVHDHLASHRDLLADVDRVQAMVRAVAGAVHPGDVVVDLGTGTGVLAVAAARAGARRVYAIEAVPAVLDLARQVVADNGVAHQVTLIEGRSTDVELPERADVIVAELVGDFGLEEDILCYVDDGRRRFLRPGGRLVPDRLKMFAAPTAEGGELSLWTAQVLDREGIDLAAVEAHTRHLPRTISADAGQLIGSDVQILECDLSESQPEVPRGGGPSTITRTGWLCAWVGWFEMGSGGRSLLTTRPPTPKSSWGHVLIPVGDPVRVTAGDTAAMEVRFDRPFWSWRMCVGDTIRSCSEFEAMPVASLRASRKPEEMVSR